MKFFQQILILFDIISYLLRKSFSVANLSKNGKKIIKWKIEL